MCAVLHLLTATLLGLASLPEGLARATNTCYYPDGSISNKDQSCDASKADAPCCPQGWECLDGGFCYLDYAKYISRYTCTDQSWDSPACPNYCLDGAPNGTDTGNVALLNCGGDKYCCNGDRSGNCCKDKAVSYFTMSTGMTELPPPESSVEGSIPTESLPIDTAFTLAEATESPIVDPPPSTTSSPASETDHSTTVDIPILPSTAPPSTSTSVTAKPPPSIVTSIISNSNNGAPSTVYLTMTATPTATSSANDDSSSSSGGVIVGCAVGVPLSAALIGLLVFFLFRRQRRRSHKDPGNCNDLLPPVPDDHEKTPRVSELDGFPRAAGGSIAPPAHRTSNVSEYYSSKGSPAVGGVGAGGSRRRARGHAHTASEVDGMPIMAREKPPVELESRRSARIPVELEATEAGTGGGFLRGPSATMMKIGGAGRPESSQASSSPDPGMGYVVGGVGGGLRIVNAVEGELDSEVEDQRDGEASQRNTLSSADSPSPPVYQSPRSWRQQGRGSGMRADHPDGIGSPVSPLQGHGWGR